MLRLDHGSLLSLVGQVQLLLPGYHFYFRSGLAGLMIFLALEVEGRQLSYLSLEALLQPDELPLLLGVLRRLLPVTGLLLLCGPCLRHLPEAFLVSGEPEGTQFLGLLGQGRRSFRLPGLSGH